MTKINNKRLSKIMAIEFDDNDDIEEKKAQVKRKSALLELGLTSNTKVIEKTMNLTSEQITNHYGDCMKLSSENKITSKNAFDLHLIDHLKDHLQRLQNFQALSSSLDAGAKIYAGRVDMVHSNTYSICTAYEAPKEDDAYEDLIPEDNIEDINTKIEIKSKRPKKRTDINKNVTCTNIRKIRLTSAQIRSEVDPLFQTQTKNYDEGGNAELRLNNLKLLDSNYSLLLDFDSVVSTKVTNETSESVTLLDISDFSEMFKELSTNVIPISSEFENFKFTGWDRYNDNTTSHVAESLRNMMLKEESVADINRDYNDYDDDGGGCGDPCDDGEGYVIDDDTKIDAETGNKVEEQENDVVNDLDDTMLKIGSSKYEKESSLFVSNVKEMVNSFMENYGEINDNILGMWAGPDHWKQKAKPVKLLNTITDIPKLEKPKKVKKDLTPMFTDHIATRRNGDGIGRLVNIEECDRTELKGAKASKQLTDECINKNMKKEYLLPAISKFLLKSLNQLMNRDISLVNKTLKKQTEQMTTTQWVNDHLDHTDHGNDVFEVAADDMVVVDADGNLSNGGDDDDCGGDGGDGGYFDDDGDAYFERSLRQCGDFDDFDGGDMPRRGTVEAPDINYAKTAKKINVKKLKQDIHRYLTEKIHIRDIRNIVQDVTKLQMPTEFCSLSDLLSYVDEKSGPEAAKELSVAILMTCLLHLTNETGLDIGNVAGYCDFILGQGYSEYDVDQVRLFGSLTMAAIKEADGCCDNNDDNGGRGGSGNISDCD